MMKMKRSLIGIFIFAAAFFVGLWWAPLRFSNQGVGHGTVGSGSQCSIVVYRSTLFGQVSTWSCSFEDLAARDKYIARVKTDGKIISSSPERIFIQYDWPVRGYCAHRINTGAVLNICSTSFRHVYEFEHQFVMPEN